MTNNQKMWKLKILMVVENEIKFFYFLKIYKFNFFFRKVTVLYYNSSSL